jgi:hypothetical protein
MDPVQVFRELLSNYPRFFTEYPVAAILVFLLGAASSWWLRGHFVREQLKVLEQRVELLKDQLEIEKAKQGYRVQEPPKGRRKKGD